MAKNKQDKMGHAKAEVRSAVVAHKDDGSHGHTCPHCMKAHRHVDPKCQFIGLAYFSCPECFTRIRGDGCRSRPGDSFATFPLTGGVA